MENDEAVRMKRRLGLPECCIVILGSIIGTGIFISPKGVFREVEAAGPSLIIWALCGMFAFFGALCYLELGMLIPKSGGDYAYLSEALGPLPAFLYLWVVLVILVPSGNAIMALNVANYILQPFFPVEANLPKAAIQLLAATVICFLTFLNSYDIRITTRLQGVIMICNFCTLTAIIVIGFVYIGLGRIGSFEYPFKDSKFEVGKISLAFYSGIFSFVGFSYINFMAEEIKDPYKNLPRAIYICLPVVNIVYLLANTAYMVVLTPEEIISSDAIAVTVAEKSLGKYSAIVPILVAFTSFGGLSVHIMTTSRVCFVGARNGHMPKLLAHVNIIKFTPLPALVFLCLLSVTMLIVSDVYVLITYSGVVELFFFLLTVSSLLYLRHTQPNAYRPYKVPLCIPIIFILFAIFLLITPCYVAPYEVGMGMALMSAGVPVYYIGIVWQNKPNCIKYINRKLTYFCQKLFLTVPEEN